ncbi:hypothetical protein ACJX0J_030133, partial [Zea mays]
MVILTLLQRQHYYKLRLSSTVTIVYVVTHKTLWLAHVGLTYCFLVFFQLTYMLFNYIPYIQN